MWIRITEDEVERKKECYLTGGRIDGHCHGGRSEYSAERMTKCDGYSRGGIRTLGHRRRVKR